MANDDYWFFGHNLYTKLQPVLIVDPYRGNTFFIPAQHLVAQRRERKQLFNLGRCHQHIDALMVVLNYLRLKTMFLVAAFSRLVELFKILLFKLYKYSTYFEKFT